MTRQIELSDEEIKILIEILKFSIVACPVNGISQTVEIDEYKIENLSKKLEKTLNESKVD